MFTIENHETGEVQFLTRDVTAAHPAWVHCQCGTRDEIELQHLLDQCHRDDYEGSGRDPCGIAWESGARAPGGWERLGPEDEGVASLIAASIRSPRDQRSEECGALHPAGAERCILPAGHRGPHASPWGEF